MDYSDQLFERLYFATVHFSKSVLKKKQTYQHLGCPEMSYILSNFLGNCSIYTTRYKHTPVSIDTQRPQDLL